MGVTTQTRAFIGSSYKLHLGNDQSLTFGLNLGIISLQYDFNELLLEDPTDEDFMNGNDRLSKFNIGSGLLFTKTDKYYVGISAPQLLKMNETIAGFEGTRYNPHYYATAGVVLEVNRTFIKPYTNIRMVSGAPLSYDLGVSALFKERIWAGLFTRNFSNAGLNLFLTLENGMRLGYSGELVMGDPQVSSGYSTHEVSIGIDLNWLEGQTVKRRFF
ncbi:PorP/SprF family type IX secretion system membrane protein [Fulvivirga ligni]|uniref:PorP/SprF family type IX secretion system membrane protein n=1 Tax=Fulvivirga ligni TaxID=2904246 RepID=UPI00351F2359